MTTASETLDRAAAFTALKERIERDFFRHPVITDNPYTRWFKRGLATPEQVKDLLLQFSVFSNHFLVVQVKRMVNAATEEAERGARYILMNECGVGCDPKTGVAEGKTFSTRNAHINWLREIGAMLGIDPRQLGRWDVGGEETHAFLMGLDKTYGSLDPNTGAGASFAIETWAAFGIGQGAQAEAGNFWKELIVGLEGFNQRERIARGLPAIPTGFFQYHFELESGHGATVWHELEQTFATSGFDAEKYLAGGKIALDAIHTFWLGLEKRRSTL